MQPTTLFVCVSLMQKIINNYKCNELLKWKECLLQPGAAHQDYRTKDFDVGVKNMGCNYIMMVVFIIIPIHIYRLTVRGAHLKEITQV